MTKSILTATGQKNINKAIERFDEYTLLGEVDYRNELKEACVYFNPDILLVGEGLAGQESLIQIMLDIVKIQPDLRIVYLSGEVDIRDETRVNRLGVLAMAGIYDIVHDKRLNLGTLKSILDKPKTIEDIDYLIRRVKDTGHHDKKDDFIEFDIPEEDAEENDDDTLGNLYVVSSIKPGTGKSFLSTNIATAIAEYGIETEDGKKPRVALIEADLQNLSVGTLLQIEDDKKNLKTVMDKIATIIDDSGFIGSIEQTEEVNEYILSCFKPYYRVRNLEALVGSQLEFQEIEDIKPYFYIYLLETIAQEYDVVIVDSNSSLAHVTTYPILQMSQGCYYVLNLDFNNVRNNKRYKTILKEMGISHKVKYILNEDIVNKETTDAGTELEELVFTADHLDDSDFKLEARVPILPKTIFLNRLFEGTPVVLDDNDYTLKARYEIMKVANQIYPIKNFKKIEDDYLNKKQSKKKKKSLFF